MKVFNIRNFLIVGLIAGSFNHDCEALDLRNMNGNPTRQAQNSFPTAQIISSLIGILSNSFINEPSETRYNDPSEGYYQKKSFGGRPRQRRNPQLRSNPRIQTSQRPQNPRQNNQMHRIDNQRRYEHARISERHNPTQNRGRASRVHLQQRQTQNHPYDAPQMFSSETGAYTY